MFNIGITFVRNGWAHFRCGCSVWPGTEYFIALWCPSHRINPPV